MAGAASLIAMALIKGEMGLKQINHQVDVEIRHLQFSLNTSHAQVQSLVEALSLCLQKTWEVYVAVFQSDWSCLLLCPTASQAVLRWAFSLLV